MTMKRLFGVVGSLSVTLFSANAALAQGEPPPAPPASEPAPAPEPAAAPAPAPAPAAAPPAAQQMAPPADAAPTEAPGAHTHDGFFMRLGLDVGPVAVTEKITLGNTTSPDIKWSGMTVGYDLLLGGTPAPGLAIGGALLVTTTSSPKLSQGNLDVTASGTMVWSGVGVFGDYYFDPHGGGHVQATLGYSSISFVSTNGNSTSNSPSGILAAIGGGYDFWIGNQWSVGPMARLLYANMSYSAGGAKDSVSYLYPSIGVGFVLH